MKKVLILVGSGPYGMAHAAEAFRAAIGVAGLGSETKVVLLEDGTFVAVKGHRPEDFEMKPLDKAFEELKSFNASLFILKESMEERGINSSDIIDAAEIDRKILLELINSSDAILTF